MIWMEMLIRFTDVLLIVGHVYLTVGLVRTVFWLHAIRVTKTPFRDAMPSAYIYSGYQIAMMIFGIAYVLSGRIFW